MFVYSLDEICGGQSEEEVRRYNLSMVVRNIESARLWVVSVEATVPRSVSNGETRSPIEFIGKLSFQFVLARVLNNNVIVSRYTWFSFVLFSCVPS